MAHKILIVDDEDEIRLVLSDRLTFHGFEVIEAKHGSQGIDFAKKHKPDVVLLDIAMPRMTGHRVWTYFQKGPDLKEIPILIITAKPRSTDTFWGFSLSPFDYFSKPLDMEPLVKRIWEKIREKETIKK